MHIRLEPQRERKMKSTQISARSPPGTGPDQAGRSIPGVGLFHFQHRTELSRRRNGATDRRFGAKRRRNRATDRRFEAKGCWNGATDRRFEAKRRRDRATARRFGAKGRWNGATARRFGTSRRRFGAGSARSAANRTALTALRAGFPADGRVVWQNLRNSWNQPAPAVSYS